MTQRKRAPFRALVHFSCTYLSMLEDIRDEVGGSQRKLTKIVDDVFAKGMDGSDATR